MDMIAKFQNVLREKDIIAIPGVQDCLAARVAERAGADVCYLTGFGVVGSTLGIPDIGLFSLDELAERARNIAGCVNIPVLCDIDTGFGGPLNIRRTINLMERAGIVGALIEDQDSAHKHCSEMNLHISLVSAEQMELRIKAACEARNNKGFVIIARCDAKDLGMDEVKRRIHRYLSAGADLVLLKIGRAHV